MLKIKIPNLCQSEQQYALDILLGEFLGLAFEVKSYKGDVIEIIGLGHSSGAAKLTLDASFFHKAHKAWLQPESMPVMPLQSWTPEHDGIHWTFIEPTIPVLYGKPHSSEYKGLVRNGEHLHLNLDIFGSAFFMLSRYEELVIKKRDSHNRFPATASVGFEAEFLDRPIVNEYLEILWWCITQLWPDLVRKERKFRKLISCDVDHPSDLVGYSLKRTILRVGARLLRDKNPKLALYDALNYVFKKFDSDRFDEYRNNIEWMMKINDAAGNIVAFYFIPIQTDKNKEDPNDVRNPKISALLKYIIDSGHEIGTHPGYQTYNDPINFENSINAFKQACEYQSISITKLGGRQHYLMYDVSQTPKLWERNGLSYDSSLGFADKAGFRCGTCYEYNMYDLNARQSLSIKQRPLVVMETTIISDKYEGFGFSSEAFERFVYFSKVCKKFNGDFTCLWHNSSFSHRHSHEIYKKIVLRDN